MIDVYAIIRIRGSMETSGSVEQGLMQMHLTRKNHCVLLPINSTSKGVLKLGKDYITWGEVSQAVVEKLLRQRGELTGGQKLTDEYLIKNSKFKSISELAKGLFEGTKMSDVKGLKPLFRLNSPRKGFEGVKLPYPKGSLGYRKDTINELIERML